MAANVRSQIVGLQTTSTLTDNGLQTPVHLHIPLDSCSIVDANTNKTIGELSRNARKVMDVLQQELSIQAFVDQSPTRHPSSVESETSKQPNRARQGTPKLHLELFIILYGLPTAFDNVGKFTATCNLYLQHPKHCNRNVPYKNPHCLTPRQNETIYTYDLAQARTASDHYTDSLPNPIDLFTGGEDQAGLEEADSPHHLRTQLYRHQKQALTFMLQREEGWAFDGHHRDIWKHDYAVGRVTYVNTITSRRQIRPPPPFRGGLLIDAPGLGKSLSIIALVAASRSRDISLKTLLIVPKTCWFMLPR